MLKIIQIAEYWQLNRWDAKDGMAMEFESAVAKKTKKFNNTPETAILTFQIVTGPDSGKYMRVVGPKSADFFDKAFRVLQNIHIG